MDVACNRVLVIEDEFLVAAEIRFHLQCAGFDDVGHAATEADALTAIDARDWSAAIVDANLNGRGIDSIASTLLSKRIPFFIVTGYGEEALPKSVAGVAVINKPFRPETLVDTVTRLCSVRSA